MAITRRAALRLGAAGAAGLTGLSLSGPASADLDDPPTTATSALLPKNTPRPYAALFKRPPVLVPYDRGEDEQGRYARYELTQQVGAQLIVPGLATLVAGYNGIFPGPTIKANQGERVEVRRATACTRARCTRGGSRRRPTCTARPRCPSTTGTPATSPSRGTRRTTSTRTGSPVARSGTTTTTSW